MADKPEMIVDRVYAAIRYAEKHDLHVLPDHTIVDGGCSCGNENCDRPGKHPMTPHGVKDASNEITVIANWWNETQGLPNVGIATGAVSKIVVVDIDVKSGGMETLAVWKQEHGEMPKTPTVKTPTGGLHVYFKYPDGKEVGSKTGIAPGIDIRGNGGQVVAPPSVHANGGKYEWLVTLATPLAEIPAWLLDLISNPKPKSKTQPVIKKPVANPMVMTLTTGSDDLRTSPGAGEGERHDTLCKLVGMQLARGEGVNKIEADAQDWAKKCVPPMEPSEVTRTVLSLANKHNGTTAHAVLPASPTTKDDVEGVKLPEPPPWPVLKDEARHGLVGDYLLALDGATEADPVGILVSQLVAFGSCVGRSPRFQVEGDFHHVNEFAVTVGQSSKGRKGTGLGRALAPLQTADPEWHDHLIVSGMSSGEGVIWLVRDPITMSEPVKDKGTITGYQMVTKDPGVEDKRLLVTETEFAQVLKVLRREGNTLSPIIRQAWDRGSLRAITKNSPAKATDAHVSILGHISRPELQRCLSDTEMFNGFANRFLWVLVKRHQFLPEGGDVVDVVRINDRMAQAVTQAKTVTNMTRSPEARQVWRQIYSELTADRPGLYGAVTGRAEAHVLRLSMLYALLDGQSVIAVDHLQAALALWSYCDESARIIFGESEAEGGDALEQQLLALIRQTPGINRRGLHQALGGHVNGTVLVAALAKIRDNGLVRCEKVSTGGRPGECWYPREWAATA